MQQVTCIPTPRSALPSAAPATLCFTDGATTCLVDAAQLDPRMPVLLETVTAAISRITPYRPIPLARPWGRVTVRRADITIDHSLMAVVTPAGIDVPVPRHLISEELAGHLARLGTASLRWFVPGPQ